MFSDFDAQTRQMLTGNLLMIGCCAFYLAWWLIAFRPEGAVKGIRSGWLLIPALLFGVAAVTLIFFRCQYDLLPSILWSG